MYSLELIFIEIQRHQAMKEKQIQRTYLQENDFLKNPFNSFFPLFFIVFKPKQQNFHSCVASLYIIHYPFPVQDGALRIGILKSKKITDSQIKRIRIAKPKVTV